MASLFAKLSPGGRALATGIPVVAATYYAFWTGLQMSQKSKDVSKAPAAVPTWQHRLAQAASPTAHADTPATLRAARFEPAPAAPAAADGAATFAGGAVAGALWPAGQQERAGEGPVSGKTPQRPQQYPGKEGLAYTKAPDYVANYEKTGQR